MHELSIAGSIAEVAERHADGRRVTAVSIRVGQMRQVAPSALRFAFELVTSGTPLAGASLRIEHVAVRGRCRVCGAHRELRRLPLACEACGGADLELTAGEELEVLEIEVEQEPRAEVEPESGAEVEPESGVGIEPESGVGIEPESGVGIEPKPEAEVEQRSEIEVGQEPTSEREVMCT